MDVSGGEMNEAYANIFTENECHLNDITIFYSSHRRRSSIVLYAMCVRRTSGVLSYRQCLLFDTSSKVTSDSSSGSQNINLPFVF